MRFTASKEMEYLGAIHNRTSKEVNLARELSRRLNALRCYDQYFCDLDWQPQAYSSASPQIEGEKR
jgi:hypothetical protein